MDENKEYKLNDGSNICISCVLRINYAKYFGFRVFMHYITELDGEGLIFKNIYFEEHPINH